MTRELTIPGPGASESMAGPGELNLFDPRLRFDSAATVALRERHWFARTPMGPALLRYAECAELAPDRRLRQQGLMVFKMQGVTEGLLVDWFSRAVLAVEDDTHQRLRRLVSSAFAPQRIKALRPVIRELAVELSAGLADRERVDFMAEFAEHLPIRVMGLLLGVDPGHAEELGRWVDDLGLMFSLPVHPHLPRIEAALAQLYRFTDDLLAQRERSPGEDLVSHLLRATVDGDRLSWEELRTWVIVLLLAGHDTTRCQLGQAIATFCDHPDQWALLRERPGLAASAVEEVMRFAPIAPVIFRVARTDFTYRDLTVHAGEFVALCIALAQTDPRAFAAGFDITVPRAAHLTIGGGPHFCLGAGLARIEMEEAFPILAERMPHLALAGDPTWRPPVGITGPATLPISTRAGG
jgi:cytochrome P450